MTKLNTYCVYEQTKTTKLNLTTVLRVRKLSCLYLYVYVRVCMYVYARAYCLREQNGMRIIVCVYIYIYVILHHAFFLHFCFRFNALQSQFYLSCSA